MIQPLGNCIVGVPQKQEKIILKGEKGKKLELDSSPRAKVVAVGPGVSTLKVDDVVLYKPFATYDYMLSEKEVYIVLEEPDVLGLLV